MKRLNAALLALIAAIAMVGCAGLVSANHAVPPILRVATSSLPGGHVQASYSATLAATGGTQPYSWSVAAGSLPPGLTLSAATGLIAGMPSVSGQYSFTVQVSDPGSSPQSARQAFTISIAAAGPSPLQITTSSLPGGQLQASYSATLAATGGTQPYSWSVAAGSLPPGLALSASTGVIAGMPSASGQYSFTVQVTDLGSSPQSARQTFTISIAASTITRVTVTPNPAPCIVGGTVQFKAVDQNNNDITATSVWSSTDSTIASISSSGGLANCLANGTVTITATH
jgi:hypothetical protein